MKQERLFPVSAVVVTLLLVTATAVSADIFTKPSVIKELVTTSLPPDSGTIYDMSETTRDAGGGGVFTVPTGKVFVITTIVISPQTLGAGTINMTLAQDDLYRQYWVVPSNQLTTIQIPTGFVVGPGYTVSVVNHSTSSANIRVRVFGYLAKDR